MRPLTVANLRAVREPPLQKFMEPIVFYITAAITVFAVVLMIFQSNPVASAIFLVLSLFSLAAIYVLLGAFFVAALQILVYAGAVMVLFVFVIMLLNLRDDELVYDKINLRRIGVGLLGLTMFGLILSLIAKIPASASFGPVPEDFGSIQMVAQKLMGEYVVPFELMGVLLLVGLVGAILLGRKDAQ